MNGIVTARDVLKIFANNSPLNVPISNYMSFPIQTLTENATVKEALDFITRSILRELLLLMIMEI